MAGEPTADSSSTVRSPGRDREPGEMGIRERQRELGAGGVGGQRELLGGGGSGPWPGCDPVARGCRPKGNGGTWKQFQGAW